ncbi:MAG: polysaccharide lyase family 7 protein [Gammaproteobacteria bacterium]|nr:polysaccharide lyase family 7 protein [Gammaproteobacteria bacterium]
MRLSTMQRSTVVILIVILGVGAAAKVYAKKPGEVIDLSFWKLTLPTDSDNNGTVDEISVQGLAGYEHKDYFHVDKNGFVVFTAPNKAATTANSTNTRSELRQMFRGRNTRIQTHAPKNNFALKAHQHARRYADIGGQLDATLRVLHVAIRAKYPEKPPAFSVVVGQIHALRNESLHRRGFGYGNEPLKIFYKKWPGHSTGSVFWTYERNLAVDDPNRTDLSHTVWGRGWDDPSDPGEEGIPLGALFNYNVNVFGNVMYLTFRTTDPSQTKTFEIDLASNVDEKDNANGYAGDSFYFKAGAYNQCSAADEATFRYPACQGTGDWETDRANGDYTSVAFRRIVLTRAVDPTRR